MSLNFFADHCVPTSIVLALANAGHGVCVLRDYIPKTSDDSQVIAKSQELESILLSLNGDFSDIVSYPPSRFGGIIAIQVRNHPETIPVITERLLNYLAAHPDREHYRGKLLLVESHRIRIR
jgi:predicted nuclease of predicted toxin-antitoxin system